VLLRLDARRFLSSLLKTNQVTPAVFFFSTHFQHFREFVLLWRDRFFEPFLSAPCPCSSRSSPEDVSRSLPSPTSPRFSLIVGAPFRTAVLKFSGRLVEGRPDLVYTLSSKFGSNGQLLGRYFCRASFCRRASTWFQLPFSYPLVFTTLDTRPSLPASVVRDGFLIPWADLLILQRKIPP